MSKQPKLSPEDSLYGSLEDELRESGESETEEQVGWDDREGHRPSSKAVALLLFIPLGITIGLACWLIVLMVLG